MGFPRQESCSGLTFPSPGDLPDPGIKPTSYQLRMLLLLLLLSHFSRVQLCVTPQTAAHHAPPSRDSPGKNTGVGCHFLFQRMKVKSEREVAQSCLTLRDPMDCSPPGSSAHEIFQATVLEWGANAFSVLSA